MSRFRLNTGNLVLCILELLIGVLLCIDPVGFTSCIIVVLGIVLAVVGIANLLSYFRSDPRQAALENGFAKGLLLLLGGLFCVFRFKWFFATFPVLTVLYGVFNLLGGISKIQWGLDMFRLKEKYWYAAIISAVFTLLFAGLILADPFSSTEALWTFVSVTFIVEAAIDLATFIFEHASVHAARRKERKEQKKLEKAEKAEKAKKPAPAENPEQAEGEEPPQEP